MDTFLVLFPRVDVQMNRIAGSGLRSLAHRSVSAATLGGTLASVGHLVPDRAALPRSPVQRIARVVPHDRVRTDLPLEWHRPCSGPSAASQRSLSSLWNARGVCTAATDRPPQPSSSGIELPRADSSVRTTQEGLQLLFGSWTGSYAVIYKPAGVPVSATSRDSVTARLERIVGHNRVYLVRRIALNRFAMWRAVFWSLTPRTLSP